VHTLEEILKFSFGPNCGGQKPLDMLISYNDDAGSHANAKIVALCGFLGSLDDWAKMDAPWRDVLHKRSWPSRIKAFHTVDCVNGFGDFSGWTYAQRLAMFGDLVSVLLSFPIHAIGAAIVVEHLNALTEDEWKIFKGDRKSTPLEFIFHLQMQQIVRKGSQIDSTEEIGVAFENTNRATERLFTDIYIDYRDGFYGAEKLMRSPAFIEKKYPAMQAADMLAYCTFQLAMENYYPKTSVPNFDVMPPFQRMIEGVMHDGGIYDADALRSLLVRIKANDPTVIGNRRKRLEREENS
jgi:hypothetical protein